MSYLKKFYMAGLGLALVLGANAETSKTFQFSLREARGSITTGIYPSSSNTVADFAWAEGYSADSVKYKKTTPYPIEMILKGVPFNDGLTGDVKVKIEFNSDEGFVTFSNGGIVLGNPWPAGVRASATILEATTENKDHIVTANFIGGSFLAGATLDPGETVESVVVGSINGVPVDFDLSNHRTAESFTMATSFVEFAPTNTATWIVDSHKLLPNIRDMKIQVTAKPVPKLKLRFIE